MQSPELLEARRTESRPRSVSSECDFLGGQNLRGSAIIILTLVSTSYLALFFAVDTTQRYSRQCFLGVSRNVSGNLSCATRRAPGWACRPAPFVASRRESRFPAD